MHNRTAGRMVVKHGGEYAMLLSYYIFALYACRVATWVVTYLELTMWQMVAVRQGNRIRKQYLRAIM